MKLRASFAILTVAIVGLFGFDGGCGTTATDLPVTFSDEHDVQVVSAGQNTDGGSVTEDGGLALQSDSADQVVDVSSQSALTGKLSSLKSFTINTIDTSITAIDASNVTALISGDMEISHDGSDGSWQSVGSYTNLAITQGASVTITPDSTQQAAVGQILGWVQSDGKFHYRYHSSVDALPSDFTVHTKLSFTATVGL